MVSTAFILNEVFNGAGMGGIDEEFKLQSNTIDFSFLTSMIIVYFSTGMYTDALKDKAGDLWETIVRLETEKYDLQERQHRQDYDVSFILLVF